MTATPSLATRDLTIRFGGHVAVNAVTAEFYPGTLTVIVGPNGAGKTTYFNLVSGQLPATSGSVFVGGQDVTRLGPAHVVMCHPGQDLGEPGVVDDIAASRAREYAFLASDAFPDLLARRGLALASAPQRGGTAP